MNSSATRNAANGAASASHSSSVATARVVDVAQVATLVALAFVAFVALFSEPMDGGQWVRDLFVKALGLAVGAATARLYLRWRRVNAQIRRYEAWCAKGMEPDGDESESAER